MAEAKAGDERVGGVPWEIDLGLRLGLGPAATGLLVAAVLVAGTLVFHAAVASGVLAVERFVGLGFATRAALVASLTTGYVFFASRYGALGGFRDTVDLGLAPPGLDPSREEARLHRYAAEMRFRSRRAGLLGVAFFVLTIEVPNAIAGGAPFAAWFTLDTLSWLQAMGVLFFFVTGRSAFFSLASMRAMRDLALGPLRVDLLDPAPLGVFGRAAVRNFTLWIVGFSLASLVFLNPELDFRQSLIVFVPILLATVAIASLALWLPLSGIHRRIEQVKTAELGRVDAALRGEPGALRGSRIEERAGELGLGDLIAYRNLIGGVSPWPLQGSALRVLLLALIPAASWLGGALVEVGVEAAIR